MRYILTGMFILACAGCVSMEPGQISGPQRVEVRRNFFPDPQKIGIGMGRSEVDAIMGTATIIGYSKDGQSGAMEPVTVPEPYRTEKLTSDGREYEVLYYLHAVKRSDGVVSDDELYPVIFINGKVIDKGAEALEQLRAGKI